MAKITPVLGSKPIKIITGFRRSGKSFLTQQIIQYFVNNNLIERDNFLYINFEDYRFESFNTNKDLARIYKTFRESICSKKGRKVLVFDEIQKITGWDKFIRTIYERDRDVEIVLTGSNSEMLSSELGSNLAGRFIEFNVMPFDFVEYLEYHSMAPRDKMDYIRHSSDIHSAFYAFLTRGGLPETFEIRTIDAALSYLQGIVTKIILDDVVKRFKVENVEMLERLFRYLIAECGKQVSFHNLCTYLHSMGIETKVETVIKYVGYIQKAFAIQDVFKFAWTQKKVFSTQKKYYAIDTGLISIYRKISENYSFRLENLVVLELHRRYKQIYYGKSDSDKEIDFIVTDDVSWHKFQVCQRLTAENLKRETSVFENADKFLTGDNILLTMESTNIEIPSNVRRIDLIEWFLRFPE